MAVEVFLALTVASRLPVDRVTSTRSSEVRAAALLAAGDRRPRLGTTRSPTVAIHGDPDPLVSMTAGREVADAIPGARFVAISGMGRSLTPASVETLLEGLTGSPAGDEHD